MAREREPRQGCECFDPQQQEIFVVLFESVVAGLPALYELAFKYDGLRVAAGVKKLKVCNAVYKRRDFRV